MLRRLLAVALMLLATSSHAGPTPDHLQCSSIKDAAAKGVYTVDLTPNEPGFAAAQGCGVKMPAKLLCVDTVKSNVTPAPPGGVVGTAAQTYLCYKAKCPKAPATATFTDQFGVHPVTVAATKLLCAPAAEATTTTTTTTTPVTTTTSTIANCISDNQPCSTNASCCSGTCSGGACVPLSTACLTLGNACTQNGECCSELCQGGRCSASSFCRQTNDVCSVGSDCCSGTCTIASGASLGTCAAPVTGAAACSGVDGTVCDSALTCGAGCCSGLCAPYGPTGVAICQPSSGCHATGDTCTQDSDCCGGPGLPGGSGTPVTCAITPPATTGSCRVPAGCHPDGALCRLVTESCNRSCDCCSGNCLNEDTCKPDEGGVARCAAATCVAAGGSCASSANCCNGAPCVPNPSGTPPFVCLASTCAAAGEPCTVDADCCAGATCVAPVGSARGTCTQ